MLLVAIAAVAAGVGSLVPAAASATAPAPATVRSSALSPAERGFVDRINDFRTGRHLRPLVVDAKLTGVARSWSAGMAERKTIFHNYRLPESVRARWRKLGENVGMGGDVNAIFAAFVASPTHLRNLVDPAWSRLGVGVVVAGDGTYYTAHEFMAVRTRRR